jgi:hypothetical protein
MSLNNLGEAVATLSIMKDLLPEYLVEWQRIKGKDVIAIASDNKYILIDIASIKNLDNEKVADKVAATIRRSFEGGEDGQSTK